MFISLGSESLEGNGITEHVNKAVPYFCQAQLEALMDGMLPMSPGLVRMAIILLKIFREFNQDIFFSSSFYLCSTKDTCYEKK